MRTITFIVGDDIELSISVTDELAAQLQAQEDGETSGIASYVIEPMQSDDNP